MFSDRDFAVQYVFMDNTTYEETRLKKDESWSKYLKEGAEVALLVWNGRVISVDSPSTVELEVADTDPGLKGNTAAGGTLLRCCSTCYSSWSDSYLRDWLTPSLICQLFWLASCFFRLAKLPAAAGLLCSDTRAGTFHWFPAENSSVERTIDNADRPMQGLVLRGSLILRD